MLIKKDKTQSIDQLSIAKIVATRLGLDLNTVIAVIDMEQKTTMSYIKRMHRVVKKNYLTLTPRARDPYTFTSGIDGKEYNVPKAIKVSVRIGEGFKAYVSDFREMSDKLCRFVAIKKEP